jgi:hypothetical protein
MSARVEKPPPKQISENMLTDTTKDNIEYFFTLEHSILFSNLSPFLSKS